MSPKNWIRTAATVALVVFAASACGQDDPPLTKGTPVPSPKPAAQQKTAPPHREPSDKAPVLEKIKYDLENRVLAMGGMIARPTSSTCDTAKVSDQPQTFTCTVSYLGVQVPFRVATKGGSFLVQYTATPTKGGVITREGVQARAWKQYGTLGGKTRDSLRCDEIPAVRLVPVDRPSGYRCYVGDGGLKGTYDVIIGSNGMSLR
ncbi:hypothetical protein ACH4Q6_18310 [Streptomyces lydicus]|uniref:hypothetical protein n=1 Tax=Streptomyces lydicus TaxID=47763 RepID=UPI0037B10494